MGLTEYRKKRNFKRTPEPNGNAGARPGGRQFVIQKHDARQLHYDFRLELDGVLKSWAVPKGPSLDPSVKALAVEVEDHPLEYASFEGVIPKGEYGGGTVMVWDRGEWASEQDVAKALEQGDLKFVLAGEKLQGLYKLIRMKGRGNESGKNWLLIKGKDEYAQPSDEGVITETRPESVLTGRSIEEIAEDSDRVWHSHRAEPETPSKRSAKRSRKSVGTRSSKTSRSSVIDREVVKSLTGARKGALPREFRPQLATLGKAPPEGDRWLHELKFDGYRVICRIDGEEVQLLTRQGHDWSHRFPEVVEAARDLGVSSALLDGEVVALDEHGVSDFQRLQNWLQHGRRGQLVYYVFDLPYAEGFNLQKVPLIERKELLSRIVLTRHPANDGTIRYSDHIRGNGPLVLKQSCEHALEGIISKKVDAKYENRRSPSWLKSKCQGRQEFVIGGFTAPEGQRTHFGALLVGYLQEGEWVYCGRVGTGFTQETLADLHARMRSLERKTPAFRNPPRGARARGVTWIQPKLVAEIEFTEWTSDGMLRHPAFKGLREDKAAEDVTREPMARDNGERVRANGSRSSAARTLIEKGLRMSGSSGNTIAGVTLSNPDRVLYPDQQVTKRRLAEYYVAVEEWVLPYVVDRPLTLVRCPQGQAKKCFYQKHWTDSLPETVHSVEIKEKAGKEPYVVIKDLAGLISLVQMNVLELHPWGSRVDRLERPDQIVFDLDPGEGVPWEAVVEAAREIGTLLEALELRSFVRTTGGKGLHVVLPLSRRHTWDEVGDFAEQVATLLVGQAPEKYVANMRKAVRKGKIFVDYLRNRRGATSIASYSTRARENAPVATPVSWDELDEVRSGSQWTIETVPARLAGLGADPWEGFQSVRQSITKSVWKQLARP